LVVSVWRLVKLFFVSQFGLCVVSLRA
jgi:hypothetical protein